MLLIQVATLAVLLVLAGFFAMAETSLLATSHITARKLSDEKKHGSSNLLKLLDRRSACLSTILLLTLMAQLTATTMATTIAYQYFRGTGSALATGAMTLIIFIYAEVAPKNYTVMNSEKVALFIARPILAITGLLHPVIVVLTWISTTSGRILGLRLTSAAPYITEEEILAAMDIGEEEGVIEEEEKKMIHHIFEFGDTIVREIMTPRPDIASLPASASTKEAIDLVLKEGHSRIPVYKGALDNVVGVVYARDLLDLIRKEQMTTNLDSVLRPAIIIPETKKVSELLRELQKRKIHMVIVIDEHGTTVGLATIEDLLEEIVGEIYDEYDFEEQLIQQIDKNKIRVDGRVTIDDINELLGVELADVDVDTIGGLMLELFGHIPRRGEEITYQDLEFKVEKVIKNRVMSVIITRLDKTDRKED